MQMNDSAVSDWPTPSSPRPFRADPHPLSPAPSQLPTPGEGECSANRLLAGLPLLPVWGVGRGREKRAGGVRVFCLRLGNRRTHPARRRGQAKGAAGMEATEEASRALSVAGAGVAARK